MMEIHCVIEGKVQGVAYRAFAEDAATRLGVNGYVCNTTDGAVEIIAQADPDTLKEFIEYLHEGSLHARVEGMAVDWQKPRKTYSDFSVLH